MNSRRVAIHLTSTGGFYGAERALLELATYLRDQGWDSRVVALEGIGAAEVVKRALAEGLSAEAFVAAGRLNSFSMVKRLRSLLLHHPRAVVHSHGYKPDILLSLMRIPRRQVCLATCHGWYSLSYKQRLLLALDKRVVRRFDHVIAVSDEIERELVKNGVPAPKVTLIRNGISALRACPDARSRVREEMRAAAEDRVIVQIGRLGYPKRNEMLLEAVAALPPPLCPHVWLVGEGDQKLALMEFARQRGLQPRVRFCGYRHDIADILAASDLLAVTSDTEGMPITVLEAMSMRCPIVSTTVGAIPRVLKDGETAWLVPRADPTALTRALAEALAQPEMARRRAANAYGEYCRAHSRESMGAHYLEIYEAAWVGRGW